MTNLKKQLIRLGDTNPELRDHLRPILSAIDTKTAGEEGVYAYMTWQMADPIPRGMVNVDFLDYIDAWLDGMHGLHSWARNGRVEITVDSQTSGRAEIWNSLEGYSRPDDLVSEFESDLANALSRLAAKENPRLNRDDIVRYINIVREEIKEIEDHGSRRSFYSASPKTASQRKVKDKLNEIFDSVRELHARDNYVVWGVKFPGGEVEAHYVKDEGEFKITDPQGQEVWYVGQVGRRGDWGPVEDAVEAAEDARLEDGPAMVYFRDTLLLHF